MRSAAAGALGIGLPGLAERAECADESLVAPVGVEIEMAFWGLQSVYTLTISAFVIGSPNALTGERLEDIAPLGEICRAQFETAETGVFRGVGVVTEIQASTGALTLDHEDIKGLMPAMIMMYRVKTPRVSHGLKVGDRVEFEVDAKSYTILSAKVIAPAK